MALSDRHLIAAAVAVCAFIAAMKLPPDLGVREHRVRHSPEIRVQNRARSRFREAQEKLALLERRDEALRLAAHTRAGGHAGPRVVHGADVPRSLRTSLDSLLRRELGGLRTPLDTAPVLVYVVLDTATRGNDALPGASRTRWIDAQYVLPAAVDGRTCVSIVRVGQSALDDRTRRNGRLLRDIALDGAAGKMLGPCAFIGAYGTPGPRIGRWLATTNHGLLLRSPAPGTDTLRTSLPSLLGERETIVEIILRSTGWSPQRDWLHPDLVACAAGHDGRCLAALGADAVESARADGPMLLRSSGNPFDRDAWPVERTRLMGSGVWLFASLHDRVGPEAFGRFWTSDLTPDQAWAHATGAPLAESTRDWVAETFEVGRTRRWPHPTALLLQLALAAVGVGGAIVLRQRRTVSA